MKKLTSIVGITFLSALLIVPVAPWAHGWGRGGGPMMGSWGGGPGYYDQNDRGYTTLNREQQERLANIIENFTMKPERVRDKLWSKSVELNALLYETNPDSGKVGKVQNEISDLQAKIDEKAIINKIEARKIAPDARRWGYGRDGKWIRNGLRNRRVGMGETAWVTEEADTEWAETEWAMAPAHAGTKLLKWG